MTASANHPDDLVHLYSDGACSGNPGPGGWAYILKHPASGKSRESWGAEPHTTNNRMELMGVIQGLANLNRHCKVQVVTDSQYVAKGISDWMKKWKAQGWKRKDGSQFKPVINEDLWRRLDELLAKHTVKVSHVLGHNGHPENERCDVMAVNAYKELVGKRR